MDVRKFKVSFLTLLLALVLAVSTQRSDAQKSRITWKPEVPKIWVDDEIAALEIPLSNPGSSPQHIPSDYYYRIPVRPIYRTYPVYAPDREPPGYLEWLRRQKPEIIFDASKLRSERDWIRAGELVFDSPIATGGLFEFKPADLYLRDPKWYEITEAPIARDGTLPFYRYVVSDVGRVEIGVLACAMCHTRVMPDGRTIKGAQGNFPFGRAFAYDYRAEPGKVEDARKLERFLYTVPGGDSRPENRFDSQSIEDIAKGQEALPPGVVARHRSNPLYPVQVPDLIGVRDRKYLDRSGLQLHRSLVDLMRYAALNQGGDDLASFGGFIPMALLFDGKLPDPGTQTRYSDEQLYALALYLYSLKPPPNPNKFDAIAARGKKVFEHEGCAACHTPPLYTNNKLTPADGFTVPAEHRKRYDILPMSVGTDPNLTLKTRRGTGYYKVPSLKGVWYRSPLEHGGSVATLEDWFDLRRLRDGYVPAGFKGYRMKVRPVRGHEFGLSLSDQDRKALISFLKTL